MRFTYKDKEYSINFQREHKLVRVGVIGDEDIYTKSKHVYTTVLLLEHSISKKSWWIAWRRNNEKPVVYRTATVGCHRRDKPSNERGRVNALRNITKTLPKDMIPLMWDAYHDRIKA